MPNNNASTRNCACIFLCPTLANGGSTGFRDLLCVVYISDSHWLFLNFVVTRFISKDVKHTRDTAVTTILRKSRCSAIHTSHRTGKLWLISCSDNKKQKAV